MAPSLWKGLVGIGLFALAHAAFSAAQHRSYMRLTEKEDESLPIDETMADEANKNLGRPEAEENPANEDMFIPPPPKRKCTEVLPSKNELANEGESRTETLAKKEKEEYEKIFQVFDKEPGTLEMTRELFENAIKEAIRFKC
ncbi:ER membrane protein complex subunit 5 isoform X1 [Dipodomys merriami]|uniref:ER membrane protein complex subunit 5 isoform X1 n=1 Tax=Dipodomys merriami TaxID=94247 RepID=UPI003855A098